MINETSKINKKNQNNETNNQLAQKTKTAHTNIQNTPNPDPHTQTYATQAAKLPTQQTHTQTSNQKLNPTNNQTNKHSNNATGTNFKTIITRIIANLSTIITLESIDTSSLDQINKAIENLISRLQNE